MLERLELKLMPRVDDGQEGEMGIGWSGRVAIGLTRLRRANRKLIKHLILQKDWI